MKAEAFLFVILGCFSTISFWIFNKVYATSQLVIDEEFHIRQGLHFCNGRFHIWDRKITTFPGLYILSTGILAPLDLCTDYHLRLISLLCQGLNFFIFYEIRKTLHVPWKIAILEALVLSLLPPLYFFGHFYYTDVPSLTFVLLTITASLKGRHVWGSIFGIFSVAMRQTNIVWIGFILGVNVLNDSVRRVHPSFRNKSEFSYSLKDLIKVIKVYTTRSDLIIDHGNEMLLNYYGYINSLVGFLGFLWYNGSIVVGDKSAHEVVIHITQVFYFSLFVAILGPSIISSKFKTIRMHIIQKWYIYLAIFISFAVIVKYNTLVHPYTLMDNRHYVHHIWTNLYVEYDWFRYAMIPVYTFSLSAMYHILKEQQSAGFMICYIVCALASLVLQKLLEMRYFLVPYVVLRVHLKEMNTKYIFEELVVYLMFHVMTYWLFFGIEIWWPEYEEAQRVRW